jgi:hypothetical protein
VEVRAWIEFILGDVVDVRFYGKKVVVVLFSWSVDSCSTLWPNPSCVQGFGITQWLEQYLNRARIRGPDRICGIASIISSTRDSNLILLVSGSKFVDPHVRDNPLPSP